jgi:hypothetical protein
LAGALFGAGSVAHAQDMQTCIASNEKSISSRKAGKFHDAIQELRTCASDSCLADIRSVCQQRISEINAAMPSIVFGAKDGNGADLTAVKVIVDGHPLSDVLDGSAIPVDPGQHVFVFEVVGQPRLERSFVIREGEKRRREVIVIGASMPARGETPSGGHGSRGTIGLVIGGVGIAGVAVGSVLGLMASSKWTSSKQECGTAGCSALDHAAATTDHDSALTLATGSTIAFIAGGAVLALGAVLFFTAPAGGEGSTTEAVHVVPAVGPGTGGLLVKGVF